MRFYTIPLIIGVQVLLLLVTTPKSPAHVVVQYVIFGVMDVILLTIWFFNLKGRKRK